MDDSVYPLQFTALFSLGAGIYGRGPLKSLASEKQVATESSRVCNMFARMFVGGSHMPMIAHITSRMRMQVLACACQSCEQGREGDKAPVDRWTVVHVTRAMEPRLWTGLGAYVGGC
jgi:hypothetical protein